MSGCGGGSSGTGAGDNAASMTQFCDRFFEGVEGDQGSYIGTPSHVADIDLMLMTAPDAIREDLEVMRGYVASGAVDASLDPQSVNVANWPESAQASAEAVFQYAVDNCQPPNS